MAEVQIKEQSNGKKTQNKKPIRVDMTPMVDLGFLLITFFMFTTNFSKPNVMDVGLPAHNPGDPTEIDYKNQLIISIAVGVDFEKLIRFFDKIAVIFRIIPNTAIEVKESFTTIAHYNANDEQIGYVKALFDELGTTMIVKEEQLTPLMALSSCGIAYAFRYIRASMVGAVEMGIYPDDAREVILQTLRGAITLLETNQSHPEVEIDKVTTPGGITIKGLNEMEANGFTNAVIKGLLKSNI